MSPFIPGALAVVAVALFALLLVVGAGSATAAAVALALLIIATGLAVIGWRASRSAERRLEAEVAAQREERAHDRAQLERHVQRLDTGLSRERALLQRLRDAWKAEREWSRELRRQIQALHARSSGRGDVLDLILEAAVRLVEAPKGVLLTREDEDGDGDLDLVTAIGFTNDPEHSAVVQRFAREGLAEDHIVREDDPPKAEHRATPADEEIDSLVAVPLYLRDRFHGVVVCANRHGGFAELDDDVLLALGNQAGAALHQGRLGYELRDAHRAVIRVLAEAVSARDPLLHRESVELAVLASGLATDVGLDEREREVLLIATLLRAVGYLPLPERLLLHRGPLSPDERSLIELHPRLGFDILRPAAALREPAIAVLSHHERYDGQGYPAGLRGQDIPFAARALSALEAYGAMTHDRPHRGARSRERACEELIENAGSQFDPEIVQLLVERVRRTRPPSEDVTEVLLESLPLERQDDGDGALDGVSPYTMDALTLLGDHRAMQRALHEAIAEATPQRRFAVVFVQLQDLPRINDQLGFPAGDRLIQVAARRAATAATRLGATAHRASGRRLALLVPVRGGDDLGEILEDIRSEFMAGPVVDVVASAWKPGDRAEDVVSRARRALKGAAT